MKKFLALMTVVLLAACTDGPPISTTPDLTFDHLSPIAINAAGVDVVDNYKPPLKDPNVEHTFHLPPYIAAERLLRHQLNPVGTQNRLRAMIVDASVVRVDVPDDHGIVGYFTPHQVRLKATMVVRFELFDSKAPDIVLGQADVVANREKTISDDISPAERDQAYFELDEKLMDNLNEGLNSIVKNTFGVK